MRMHPAQVKGHWWASSVLRCGAMVGLSLVGACQPTPSPPPGTFLVAEGTSLRALLERLVELEGTPLARAASTARRRVAACTEVRVHCPAGESCDLVDRLRCGDGPEPWAASRWRQDAPWLFTHASPGEGWLAVRGGSGPGGEIHLWGDAAWQGSSPLSLLLPARQAPGAAVLESRDVLVHARVRVDGGIDLASMIPADTPAARNLGLRHELFMARTLSGVWELAVYLPEEGQRLPPLAVALGVRSPGRARRMAEGFLEELAGVWPVVRRPLTLGPWSGECWVNLRVMPELEPCYLVTDRDLVVGWNSGSLRLVVAPSRSEPEAPSGGWLSVNLSRFPEADEILAVAGTKRGPPRVYPWSRVEVRGERNGAGHYRFDLRATPEGPR